MSATSAAAGAGPAATTISNIKEVVLGDMWIAPWYPSFYPEELIGAERGAGAAGATLERLYVCPHCFKYTTQLAPYRGHVELCKYQEVADALGGMVYEKGDLAVCEVDGEEFKLYTQNLSLFSKLFLDTKSVFYDVTTFLYYLLVYTDRTITPSKKQVVGFFSKEKLSWDNNNLACILVFPPWQRRGFGQVLMGLSYLLSKRDGRLGGPEKPLSELGRKAYVHFWAGAVARYVLAIPAKRTVTIKMISDQTYITPEDIITTLKEMQVLEHRKKAGAKAFINKIKVRAWADAHNVSLQDPVDREAFDRFVSWDDEEEDEAEEGAEEDGEEDED